VLLIDNVRHRLESASLAAAITTIGRYEDRVVGTSDVAAPPVRCMWIATANNPTMSDELARRTLRIRLDAKMEHPESRTGFRHSDLKSWVEQYDDVLRLTALTLIQAWIAAGRIRGRRRIGMFESFCETIGGILEFAGIPGFLGNLDSHRSESDQATTALQGFIQRWWRDFGDRVVCVGELFPLATEIDLGEGGDQSKRIRLGKLLHSCRDQRFGQIRIVNPGLKDGSQTWKLAVDGDGEEG
jgi:hypothetical protein